MMHLDITKCLLASVQEDPEPNKRDLGYLAVFQSPVVIPHLLTVSSVQAGGG